MTNAALTWGCAFLAFSPCLSLLFVIAFHKAQLIIVVTTSAFAYLLAAFSAALVWYIFDVIQRKSYYWGQEKNWLVSQHVTCFDLGTVCAV